MSDDQNPPIRAHIHTVHIPCGLHTGQQTRLLSCTGILRWTHLIPRWAPAALRATLRPGARPHSTRAPPAGAGLWACGRPRTHPSAAPDSGRVAPASASSSEPGKSGSLGPGRAWRRGPSPPAGELLCGRSIVWRRLSRPPSSASGPPPTAPPSARSSSSSSWRFRIKHMKWYQNLLLWFRFCSISRTVLIDHVESHFILKVDVFSVTRAFILKGCVSLAIRVGFHAFLYGSTFLSLLFTLELFLSCSGSLSFWRYFELKTRSSSCFALVSGLTAPARGRANYPP